jgi:predicted secreted protein
MMSRCLTMIGPVLACTAASAAAGVNQLTPAEKAAGWTLLFDGTSTGPWRSYRGTGFPAKGWVIDEQCLKVSAGGGGGDIVTMDQYRDFELVLEFRVAPKANSGIMYRVTEEHDTPWQTGPEYQILDDAGHGAAPTDAHSTGALYDLYPPPANKVMRGAGEFNEVRIRLKDNQLEHWLNGVKLLACDMAGEDFRQRVSASKFKGYAGFGGSSTAATSPAGPRISRTAAAWRTYGACATASWCAAASPSATSGRRISSPTTSCGWSGASTRSRRRRGTAASSFACCRPTRCGPRASRPSFRAAARATSGTSASSP